MTSGTALRLEVRDFTDLVSWRWVLTDSTTTIAEHKVTLDQRDWQFEAFSDLVGWISWHAALDTQPQDEARIAAEVGEWIGTKVLGPIAVELASRARRQDVTVQVVLPTEAADLASLPLQLAHVSGRPLAVQGVTFVTLVASDARADGGRSASIEGRLRILGLFSLPMGGQALNLRRERHALVSLVHGIALDGRAADIRVLQYGVTRESLRAVLAENEGWDVIHISGHGAPGSLVLETTDGRPDPIDAAILAAMLEAARSRIKLITIAACWSASVPAAEQRRLLDIQPQDLPRTERTQPPAPMKALATELTTSLNCAVLAMRYPVDDEFAIALSERLYALLADKGQPLPKAVGSALRDLAASGRPFPALSLAAPALFGAAATGLRLAAPAQVLPEDTGTITLKMAGFPPPPDHFVGRTGILALASAVLARDSRMPGVLLLGMPGGGKTACALELAYGHEHAFDRLVWYRAPDEGMDITGSLADFALTLERYLPGFRIAQMLTSRDRLEAFASLLAQLMQERHVLIVIDNAESLLTDSGQWRDDQWGQVIGALTGHAGPGRLILTSRRLPAGMAVWQVETGRVETLAVDALSADEALLLARELPHLRALMSGQVLGTEGHAARRLARRAVEVAQGHPKLLEFADGQAAHPERLVRWPRTFTGSADKPR